MHQVFLMSLQSRLDNWPYTYVGDCFANQAPLFFIYIPYVNGYEKATNLVRELLKSNKDFAKLCSESAKQTTGQLNLSSLLILPVQRLPRYQLLLRVNICLFF